MNDDQQQPVVPDQPQQAGTVIQPATDFHILREADEVVGAEARRPGEETTARGEGAFPVMGAADQPAPPAVPYGPPPTADVQPDPGVALQQAAPPAVPGEPGAGETPEVTPLDPVRDSRIGGLPIAEMTPTGKPAPTTVPPRPEELLAPEFLAELEAAERAEAEPNSSQNPYPPQYRGGAGGAMPPTPPPAY